MTITRTDDYIIVGELTADDQIDGNYSAIAAYNRDTYFTSENLEVQSVQLFESVYLNAEDNAYSLVLLSGFLALVACRIFIMICNSLSPAEGG